jgi:hypothetical protein
MVCVRNSYNCGFRKFRDLIEVAYYLRVKLMTRPKILSPRGVDVKQRHAFCGLDRS